MLSFVTKEQYWVAEDAGVLSLYPHDDWWHIKNIQDAIVLHRHQYLKGARMADVGGADSRTLRYFSKANECYCIDAFDGRHGGGVTAPPDIPNVQNIVAMLGAFSDAVPRNFFDVIYSISVVEHVPLDHLGDFFEDCRQALRPGAEMMHLIDLYVEDDPAGNERENDRLGGYRKVFDAGFEPMGPEILPPGGIAFSCSYATNPDNMMNRWNKSAPSLRDKRARSQACTLLLHARRR